ncbi:transposase [Streptomyces sp. NPDC023723]|uniref:transposase n=1 Tax=Streptomyces sp. NPDC023723 TaxID=3154323 RepID=UPI00340D0C39
MVRRHELTDQEWRLLAPLIPRAATGRPRVEDRRVINGMVYKIRTGISWRDLPERYGPCQTVTRTPLPTSSLPHGGCNRRTERQRDSTTARPTEASSPPPLQGLFRDFQRCPRDFRGTFRYLAQQAPESPERASDAGQRPFLR